MSKRSAAETISRILWAFIEEPTWKQAELARRVGVNVRALRARLDELTAAGMKLEHDEEPPHVCWSVPRGWLPGGLALSTEATAQVLRFVARSPRSPARDALMKKLLAGQSLTAVTSNTTPIAESEPILATLEDSITQRSAVRMRYFTTKTGIESLRHVSIQRVVYDARMRLIVFCHNARRLKWFRVSGVRQVSLDPTEPYVAAALAEVDAFAARSVGGFADDGVAREASFIVCGDDARWVASNLPSPDMTVETCPGGIRVRVVTSGMTVLARFVVGLGGAAIVETPELAERVEELARGAVARARRAADGEMKEGKLASAGVVKARVGGSREGGRVRSVP